MKLENDYQSAQQPALNIAESVVHGAANVNSAVRKSTSQTPSNNQNPNKEFITEDSTTEGGMFGSKKPSFAARAGGHILNEMQGDPLQDEDIMKIDRLQLINASARYQLLSANQQLLDFHLSRIMQSKLKSKN